MPEGGELRITTGNRSVADGSLPSGDYISVSVADTGCGIPPDVLEQIFEPFFTTKGESGTGLSLFQSRDSTQEAGWDIRLTCPFGIRTEIESPIPPSLPGTRTFQHKPATTSGAGAE